MQLLSSRLVRGVRSAASISQLAVVVCCCSWCRASSLENTLAQRFLLVLVQLLFFAGLHLYSMRMCVCVCVCVCMPRYASAAAWPCAGACSCCRTLLPPQHLLVPSLPLTANLSPFAPSVSSHNFSLHFSRVAFIHDILSLPASIPVDTRQKSTPATWEPPLPAAPGGESLTQQHTAAAAPNLVPRVPRPAAVENGCQIVIVPGPMLSSPVSTRNATATAGVERGLDSRSMIRSEMSTVCAAPRYVTSGSL